VHSNLPFLLLKNKNKKIIGGQAPSSTGSQAWTRLALDLQHPRYEDRAGM